MNQRERMLSGLPYKAWLDGLEEDRQACKQKIYDFNQLPPSRQSKEAPQMIKNIFGKTGENVWVEAPFHCDYGWNIEVGENFYSNYNLTILDVGKVTLGKNVDGYYQILSGIEFGETVVTEGMLTLYEGAKVRDIGK